MSEDPYKYSYEELQEIYSGDEFFDALQDAQLAIYNCMEMLRLGAYEIKKAEGK